MSLDSRLRLARKNGAGANLKHFEVPTICEALELLRACERAEAKGPLPAPPFPAFVARDLVEAELRDILERGRDRIVELGGDCDAMDQMMEGALHSLDMRVVGAERDKANPVRPVVEPTISGSFVAATGGGIVPGSVRLFIDDQEMEPAGARRATADAAADMVRRHAARLGMDEMAAATLERAVRALGDTI